MSGMIHNCTMNHKAHKMVASSTIRFVTQDVSHELEHVDDLWVLNQLDHLPDESERIVGCLNQEATLG